MSHLARIAVVLCLLPVVACSDGGDPGGTITVGLPYTGGGWFRMQVFDGPATEALTGQSLFDTGCLEARSRTFEITDLEAGEDRSVVFQAFGGPDCRPSDRVALGYRGGVEVSVAGEETGYYHIPVYDEGAVTALPEDLNISASTAVQVDFCDEDADCADRVAVGGGCYKIESDGGGDFNHWCVPTCESNSDCEVIHPRSTCDRDTGWCMMRSPFPLNMSEPRAFGHAAPLSDGDVLLAGGFGRTVDGRLVAADRAFERFDAATGLFQRQTVEGVPSGAVGLAGFASLGDDRFVLAGGVLSAELSVTGAGGGFGLDFGGLAGEHCTADGCEPNVSNRLLVVDVASGQGAVTNLPEPIAAPAVVVVDAERIILIGGLGPTASGNTAARQTEVLECRIGANMRATCQSLGDLNTPRADAAAVCVGADGCRDILVVGGNTTAPGAELIRLGGEEAEFVSLEADDLPSRIFGPRLCETRLVGGGRGASNTVPVDFLDLAVEDGTLTVTPLETPGALAAPLLPAVSAMPGGQCWVAGGLGEDGEVSTDVRRVTDQAVAPDPLTLHRARFGAFAAPVLGGPLAGSVLIGGGATLSSGPSGATVTPVRGAEVLRP